jgi:hypothetical protein
MFTVRVAGESVEFPARLVQLPLTSCFAPSPVTVAVTVGETRPEPLSTQSQVTVVGPVFHNWLFGGGVVLSYATLGGVVLVPGVTAFDGDEGGELPAVFVPVTVNV